jgi:hypothetical protein
MNRNGVSSVLFLGLFGATGCLTAVDGDDPGDLELAESEAALEGPNALIPNALIPNALIPNALMPSALVPSALSPSTLSPSAMNAIQDPTSTGDLSRQLLQYTVGCAFNTSQSFSFSWTTSKGQVKNETYAGILGLAPSWVVKPLSGTDQEWVSACLASRVNWYGVSIMISSRAGHPGLNKSGMPEMAAYTHNEGAFWGNVFSSTPHAYACFYGPNQDYSRSQQRDCAAGHLQPGGNVVECGIIQIVGACENQCQSFNMVGQYYSGCSGPSGSSKAVITTFLM